ncbi:hypothetical protein [Eubacterium sp. MSJ-33]|uniref:hypothetical protein n=1 Tax=Eubacterium sp. MSJ-33 TaxID=2841528 RepID=UPI001C77EBEE|nr:hypothetical protein [Eubacterium sp. MSJ-33]QWT54024.1 hypothetical protein KP625_05300 [Eubacterium sp. MSJ-33]
MTENAYKLVMLGLVTGSWLFISSMFLLKRKPRSFLFHAGMWAVLIVYFILYEFLMSYHGEVAWFPAGLVEIAVMMTVVAVNNEGDLWRNFCIVVLQQGVGSLVFSMMALPFPKLQEYQMNIVGFRPLPITVTNFLILGLMNVSCIVATLVLKFIFRKEYTGDGHLYRNIMIGYILIAYVSLASRWKLIDRIRQGDVEIGNFIALYMVWIIGIIILCNYVPYVYNRSESKRQKKGQQMLAQMLAESERHYERLVEEPFAYGQTLSGNVTLDAVVADYTKRAQEQTLLFDAVVEPVHISGMAELDVTVIVDAMLEMAFAQTSTDTDAFVQLTVRQRKGSLFLDVDYMTGKRILCKKEQTLTDALIRKYEGSRQIRRKGKERQICVFLPKQV